MASFSGISRNTVSHSVRGGATQNPNCFLRGSNHAQPQLKMPRNGGPALIATPECIGHAGNSGSWKIAGFVSGTFRKSGGTAVGRIVPGGVRALWVHDKKVT